MSDPISPVPPMPVPLPLMARLDPPAEVQEAVAAALRTCHDWHPVALPSLGADASPVPAPLATGVVEAGVCDLIDDWPHHADQVAYMHVGLGVSIGLAAAVLLLMLRRAVRALGRTRTGRWLQDTLREPWHYSLIGSAGMFLGCFVGLLLTDLLRRVGLDVPGTSGVLCFVGGAVGTVGMVRLRHAQQRHDILWGQW